MIAGELPSNPNNLSEGTGPVTIDGNSIETNLANDDGGGIRLLQVSGSHITRAATRSTIDDHQQHHRQQRLGPRGRRHRARRRAVRQHRQQHGGQEPHHGDGGDQRRHSRHPPVCPRRRTATQLQARLRSTQLPGLQTLATTTFSKPTLLNDVFNDNRAGTFLGGWVYGIGATLPDGSTDTINNWDMGVADNPAALLSPTELGDPDDDRRWTAPTSTDTVSNDPSFVRPCDVTVNVLASGPTRPSGRRSSSPRSCRRT